MTRIDLSRCLMLCGFVAALSACEASQGSSGPTRSPSHDYPHLPPTTTDGQVVGADGRPPADRLQEGASSNGPAPGWTVDRKGISHDPAKRTGGNITPAETIPPASATGVLLTPPSASSAPAPAPQR